MKTAIIVGAGCGGLATAALLAKEGYKVRILEKNKQSGGRASVYKENGFSFDMGPSWYLMPEVFERFFGLFGKRPDDFFSLVKLNPSLRMFFGKGDFVDVPSDVRKVLSVFDGWEKGGARRLQDYLAQAKLWYDVSMKNVVYRDCSSLWSMLSWRLAFMGSKMFESMESHVQRFFNSDRAKKLLQYNLLFLGGSPKNTPALYSIMSYVDLGLGVWYPKGGMGSVVNALCELCFSHNVELLYDQEVVRIDVEQKMVKKVVTKRGVFEADVVVVNADYAHAETTFLDAAYQSYPVKYWESRVIAPSSFIVYLGLNKKVDGLQHHNVVIDGDLSAHFEDIFDKKMWPEKPSYYVCVPSKTDRSVAPVGCENVFILVPVAAGIEEVESDKKRYVDKIVTHLEGLIGEKLKDAVVVRKVFSGRDFTKFFNAYRGTALGLAHTLRQSAAFRPRIKSKRVKNLYYVGQYTHPGIGVPMTLVSAQLVCKRVCDEQ